MEHTIHAMDMGGEVFPVGWSLVRDMGLDQVQPGERLGGGRDFADRAVIW